ncbi:MAG TPA: diacylglycerol kinase family protein [Pseudolysinimonas sp.]|nr:diacylglycerol kinase family protein [Pseudolysinimonas sp.]
MPNSFKPKRVVVAINPSASFGATRDVGPALVQTLRAMGHDVTSLQEPDYESLVRVARAAVTTKPDGFVVVGGDGMVNLGANLVAGTKVPLGIVPSGTGNDMARSLGLPFDNTEAAVVALGEALQRPPRVIDAARISCTDDETGEPAQRWFACALSAGFDATVNERANRMHHPKGPSRYIIALGIELAKLKPYHYTLTLDGTEQTVDANMVSIGNGVSLGGGMKITPDAELDDGLLDVLIVRPLSRFNFVRIFPSVFTGEHVRHPKVSILRAKNVRIAGDGVIVYADGERIGPAPVDVQLVPGALRVLAPLPA